MEESSNRFADEHRSENSYSEAIRVLRAWFVNRLSGCSTVLFASARAREGKSTMIAALALSLAEFGKRVLVVDAELRTRGVSALLTGGLPQEGRHVSKNSPLVEVLTPPRLAVEEHQTWLAAKDYANLLRELQGQFDFLLVDSTALALSRDCFALSPLFSGSIFVTSRQRFRGAFEGGVCEDLRDRGIHLFGVVTTGI